MDFREIIRGVEGTRRTLTLYNTDIPADALDAIERYFQPQHVTIRRIRTDPPQPTNFAVLHDGDRFLGASALEDVYRQVDPARGLNTASDIAALTVPDVVEHLDNSVFSDYGKRRMIIASREIEKRAYKAGSGSVYSGFQRLSLVASQRAVYQKLAAEGLDVHVFGVPDGSPPDIGATIHGIDDPEIARSWFVVFDSDGDDEDKCALLAEETAETNTYRGFWTYRPVIVDEILAHVQEIQSR